MNSNAWDAVIIAKINCSALRTVKLVMLSKQISCSLLLANFIFSIKCSGTVTFLNTLEKNV